MPTAILELSSGIVRVFDKDNGEYGDRFDWVAFVIQIEHGVLKIVGAREAPTASQWRALRKYLRAAGFKKVVFTRHRKDGRVEHREVE